ncbi:Di-copper centre-containing protein [Parathielavia appendiculata]|uniref:Di-copper centre-containing protein n=1 Tax=Parathielavia appendiculata TaxID=2587402 RepID=A0AAN6YYJ2_9PEZI|nr:Di-copper centre-containing protein [Parathielavia appendiculata]
MKLMTFALVLLAAAFASSASIPLHEPRGIEHASPHGGRVKAIPWDEAVQIMKTPPGGFCGKVSSLDTNATEAQPRPKCANTTIRPEWNRMADADKLSYVRAVKCLMDTPPLGVWGENATRSIWDEVAWVHDQLNVRIHGVDTFLPFHRLRRADALVARDQLHGPLLRLWFFTADYFGALPPLSKTGDGTCITDGAFANFTVRSPDPNHSSCLSRGETKQTTDEATTAMLDLCHGDATTEYTQHRRCVEQTIHAVMHEGIGPTMWLLATSPNDPVFFLHHGFVDWQWKRWQDAAPGRSMTITGCAEYPADGSPCIPLTRDTVLTTMGLIPDMTVGDVLDTENDVMCYTYDEF